MANWLSSCVQCCVCVVNVCPVSPRRRSELIDSAWVIIVPGQKNTATVRCKKKKIPPIRANNKRTKETSGNKSTHRKHLLMLSARSLQLNFSPLLFKASIYYSNRRTYQPNLQKRKERSRNCGKLPTKLANICDCLNISSTNTLKSIQFSRVYNTVLEIEDGVIHN